MKSFKEVHDLYDDYIKEKKYNLNQFYNEYIYLDNTNKDMMNFILSKQDFFDKDDNNLNIGNIYDLMESKGTVRDNGNIRKVHYAQVLVNQYIEEKNLGDNLNMSPDLNYNGPLNIAMSDAVNSNNYESIKALIRQGASKEFALYSASNYRNEGLIQRLIVDNKDIDVSFVVSSLQKESPDNSKLLSNVAFASLAAINNFEEMEEIRKKSDINIGVYNNLPIRNAAANRSSETVDYLANLGASKETALHHYLKYNHNDLAYDFVEKNQDIDFSKVKDDFKKEGHFIFIKKVNDLEESFKDSNKSNDTYLGME